MKTQRELKLRPPCLAHVRHTASALLLLLAPGQPSSALAQTAPTQEDELNASQRETARAWVVEGRALFKQRNYAAALDRHLSAYRLVRVPTIGMEVARTQEAMGKWVEANATAVEVINLPSTPNEPSVFAAARGSARELLKRLTPIIPALRVEVTPASAVARVEIDGVPMSVPGQQLSFKLNPGGHELLVSAPGYLTARHTVALRQEARETIAITLIPEKLGTPELQERAPADDLFGDTTAGSGTDSAPPSNTAAYVAFGAAGVAALVGGITGTLAFTTKPDCPDDRCWPDQRDDADASLRYGTIATVSVGVAIAAGAYGLWELLAHGSSVVAPADEVPATAIVTPIPSGALLELSGSF